MEGPYRLGVGGCQRESKSGKPVGSKWSLYPFENLVGVRGRVTKWTTEYVYCSFRDANPTNPKQPRRFLDGYVALLLTPIPFLKRHKKKRTAFYPWLSVSKIVGQAGIL